MSILNIFRFKKVLIISTIVFTCVYNFTLSRFFLCFFCKLERTVRVSWLLDLVVNHLSHGIRIGLSYKLNSICLIFYQSDSPEKFVSFHCRYIQQFSPLAQEEMEKTHVLLTPFNYFEWKAYIVIQLRSKGLYKFTMGTQVEPNSAVEK